MAVISLHSSGISSITRCQELVGGITASNSSCHLDTSLYGHRSLVISKRQSNISASSLTSDVFGCTWALQRTSRRANRSSVSTTGRVTASSEKKVLIVNTNSGGHAVIGFWTARLLQSNGHSVTILTVGEETSDKMKKAPFSLFSELRDIGVKTVWGDPAALGAVLGDATFDVVLDNNGKDLEAVRPVAEWAKAAGAGQFLFISSAGIYKSTDEPPHVEGDPVKEDAGHVAVENFLASTFVDSWASFRPQYITGLGNNKDCEEWFFDRIVRDRPVPIPGSGLQMTVIAHVSDMASMLGLAVALPTLANGSIFNCVSDRAVTFDGLVRMCAKAAGKEASIVHYDPKAVGVDAKKAFPFRNQHFYSEPRAAKIKLGWECRTDFQEALNERFQDYVASGRDKKELKFDIDDQILAALGELVTV